MTGETPREHDARIVAPYDFDPGCDMKECTARATQGVRCRKCGEIVLMLCGAHAGRIERRGADATVKSSCGLQGPAKDVLEFRPLSGWTK